MSITFLQLICESEGQIEATPLRCGTRLSIITILSDDRIAAGYMLQRKYARI